MYVEWRRTQRTGLRRLQQANVPLYQRTRLFRVYCPRVMPGVLQSQGYVHALLPLIADPRSAPLGHRPRRADLELHRTL
ncbi:hypothetical protein ACWDZZ_01970 [Streptomyces sp. NPDC002990]